MLHLRIHHDIATTNTTHVKTNNNVKYGTEKLEWRVRSKFK